jgi:RimJ/RimL family protein N-acetyltransferase
VWLGLGDSFPHPYTIADAYKFLQRTIGEEPAMHFCIDVAIKAVAGIGIRIGSDVHRYTAELGYWLGEKFWGRGIMSEAVAAFKDFCFNNFQLRWLYAEPFANNHASARVSWTRPVLLPNVA